MKPSVLTKSALALVMGIAFSATSGGQEIKAHNSRQGYLQPGVVDILSILPPAPVVGDARYNADREIFKSTRRYINTPRWNLATNDVRYDNTSMYRDFSCALGVALTPELAPNLTKLLNKAGNDTQRETNVAKNFNKRLRPYKIDEGDICQPKSELGDSYDYPSGHTTGGWTWALVLSDVAPERASQIMARGRAYGESRIVCGAHNASAVDNGRLSATVTMVSVRNTATYQRDLRAARLEVSSLRRTAPIPTQCEAEAALIKENIFSPVP